MTYVLVFLQSSEIHFMEILSKDVKRPFILPTIDLWCSDGTAVRESFHKYLYSSFSSFLHIQLFQKRREASCSASESHGCRSWGRQGGQGEGEFASSHHLDIMSSCHHAIMPCQVIAAEGEQKASRALREASNTIAESASALQLRYLQVRRYFYVGVWYDDYFLDIELNICREEFHHNFPDTFRHHVTVCEVI